MTRPLCIDLFCGLGGWTEGFLAEGYDVVGFDVEQHVYGDERYPGMLALQDVLTLHGGQFRDATVIVASPPCTEFSYMAMPWKRAKQIARALRGEGDFPAGYKGSRTIAELTALFDACFRLQREASENVGRHIPLVVENVKGAQPWVGRSAWNFGSFHLWGDVPALMPTTLRRAGVKVAGMDWSKFGEPGYKAVAFNDTRHTKNEGGSWFNVAHNTTSGHGQNPNGRKIGAAAYQGAPMPSGVGATSWFHGNTKHELRGTSSGSQARKAASARIAKIPFELGRHIARTYHPREVAAA